MLPTTHGIRAQWPPVEHGDWETAQHIFYWEEAGDMQNSCSLCVFWEGSVWKRRLPWLRHLYRPVSDTGRKNMGQKPRDKDWSDRHEIFSKEEGVIIGDSLDFSPKMGRRPPGRVNGPSFY